MLFQSKNLRSVSVLYGAVEITAAAWKNHSLSPVNLVYKSCEVGYNQFCQKYYEMNEVVMELLDEIQAYWSTRTEGYSEVNQKELAGIQKNAWLKVLQEQFPACPKEQIRILDIGTGPGFFPRILAEQGYHVTAVDYTQEMIEKAKENTVGLEDHISFHQMDAQNLDFSNSSFDVVISRNLTWNLEKPIQAYKEWYRVLDTEGKLLNFDANWYAYLYDEEQRQAYEQDRQNVESQQLDDHYLCTDIDRMERIAYQMPLSAEKRPEWDIQVLREIGFEQIHTDKQIWKSVWSEEERLNYQPTPMFMITAVKGKSN